MPLPPELWTTLPNRSAMVSTLNLLGDELPWFTLSIAPHMTWLSLASLLVPLSILLSCAQCDRMQQQQLSIVILAMGLVSVFLGLLQLAQGPLSALRFFRVTNPDDAVGFFANRNHFSALLYCLIPFSAIWISQGSLRTSSARRHRAFDPTGLPVRLAGATVLVIFITAQMMTRSRAGLALTALAVLGSACLTLRGHGTRPKRRSALLLLAAIVVPCLFVTDFALIRVLDRFSAGPLADARLPIARATIEAIGAYFPFGSGIGTFSIAYGPFEQPGSVLPAYINRAHCDALELLLESGVAGLVLMALFLVWLIRRTIRVWISPDGSRTVGDLLLPRAASLVLWLLIAHSLVDYPLRTAALMAAFSFCCAVLIASPRDAACEEDASLVRTRPVLRSRDLARPASDRNLHDG
jgi:O-antigen ligase